MVKLTDIVLVFGQIKATVYSDEADAHKQQFSMIGTLLIAISTLVKETYSPPRNLTRSFFRSKQIKIEHHKRKGNFVVLPIIFKVPSGKNSPISPVQKYLVPSISLKFSFSFLPASPKYPSATTFPPISISPRGFGLSVFLY